MSRRTLVRRYILRKLGGFMSEKIADFSLNHAGTTYSRNEAGQVVSYLNFEGEVSAYGGVYGTMKVVEEFTEASATSGTCSWIGEALNEDGTRLFGYGEGTWEQAPPDHNYKVTMEGEESDGRKTRSEGAVIFEEPARFEGTVYTRD
ncbi:uncharacterized protein METZ01_LOCUS111121 [marine metagenome]|uniref:DUF3224 domain-containing protein n=1 Tax=marine metagenome TaxID=408172 RepID=A0A381X264_9ZZZZ